MILCQRASQSINLNYSVIKFLRYEGIIWQGSSLPFSAYSLGELMHAEITLINQNGERQKGLGWDQGQIKGQFRSEEIYDLSLRLEYRAPFTLDEIRADFSQIHPYEYEMSLDLNDAFFSHRNPAIRVAIGPYQKVMAMDTLETLGPEGHHITISKTGSHLGLTVSHKSTIPFGHLHFPEIEFRTGTARRALAPN